MGSNPKNADVEFVTDYAESKQFVRMHLDLQLARPDFTALRDLADAGRWDDVRSRLQDLHGAEATPYLALFVDPLADTCNRLAAAASAQRR